MATEQTAGGDASMTDQVSGLSHSKELDSAAVEGPKPGVPTNRRSSTKKMMKKHFKKQIGIDTEAINELYTYGGE